MNYCTKKRFGQHFLNDQYVIDKIMQAADIQTEDRSVEIGPGLGVLTDHLLQASAQVEAFEIDRDLIERLKQRNQPGLIVHEGDILKANLPLLLNAPPYILVANLPYNISSQVVFLLIQNRQLFRRMVLMFQKEVGERLCAVPGTKDYGILSVLCQLWFDIERVVEVGPESFSPPPKVDSLVLRFEPLAQPRVDPIDTAFFTKVVKAAFTQRRKQIRNSLMAGGFPRDAVDAGLVQADIASTRRGETLDLPDFSRLTQALIKQ
ncbi:MAG: 16S rRNA (adenine(1518)-N(6)/adenine(1519)-N(6))-dimethyltransferase RsmA [Geopsychrobacter sp.]|nr:16S rRNA (adenine(1518)-N(6)/adenine(1519)-N(6))-dimethyltransferase RsmA [Geopsychrobacter sp.]